MDRNEYQETIIRGLHELLPHVLSISDFGPSFAKFLREKREKLHPVGVENVQRIETASGLKLNVNLGDRLGCDFFYGFFQEAQDFHLLMALIKPGCVFVDVGANIGFYTLEASLRGGPTGRVVAIEPDPRSVQLLKQNINQNGMVDRVQVVTACAGPRDGEVEFFAAAEPSFSGMRDNRRSPVVSVSKVPMRSLDSLLTEIGCTSVDIIKIDVEGFEADVLDGSGKTLSEFDPVIMLELSQKNTDDDHTGQSARILSRMADYGYNVVSVSPDGSRILTHNALPEAFTLDSASHSGNFFFVRHETDAARRLEDASILNFLTAQMRRNFVTLGQATSPDSRAGILVELLGFFNTKFSQALAGREAHKLQLEQANAELTHALAGREAYKLQLEQANAELTQAIAGREAYKLQLEQANAELTHALAGREAYKQQLEQANAELTHTLAGREAYKLQLELASSSREAYKQQLEQVSAKLTHALAGREAYIQQLKRVNAELAHARSTSDRLKTFFKK